MAGRLELVLAIEEGRLAEGGRGLLRRFTDDGSPWWHRGLAGERGRSGDAVESCLIAPVGHDGLLREERSSRPHCHRAQQTTFSGRGRALVVLGTMLQTRCVLRVAALRPSELETVDQHLPLNRLDQYVEDGSTYLIAWDDDRPVGHAHIAWQRTHVGVPEIQDVFVVPERRRQGLQRRCPAQPKTRCAAPAGIGSASQLAPKATTPHGDCTTASVTAPQGARPFGCTEPSRFEAVLSRSTTP